MVNHWSFQREISLINIRIPFFFLRVAHSHKNSNDQEWEVPLYSLKSPKLNHFFLEWSLYSTTKRLIVVITTVPILHLWGNLDWHNRAINWRVYWHMRFLLPFITQVACIASTTNESPFCVCFFIISLCTWNNSFCHYNMIKELLILNNYTFSYDNIHLCSITFSYIG